MIWAVVMAGGKGTRFWPKSRLRTPKQLQRIVSNKTMIAQALGRLSPIVPPSRVIVVTHRDQFKAARRCLPKVPKSNFIIEAVGRNTAPCILVASLWIKKKDPDALTVVLPADHIIQNKKEFQKDLRAAVSFAKQRGAHITFGIKPNSANTGYGYIERARRVSCQKGVNIYKVKKFTEKPILRRAEQFVKSGRYYWNSGMFVWSCDTIIESYRKHLPRIYRALKGYEDVISGFLRAKFIKRAYRKIPSVSVDYGIMERTRSAFVLQAMFDWSDVGSWRELENLWPKDKNKNACRGRVIAFDSKNNILFSDKRLVASVGLKDMIVVETDDAVLVCPKSCAQDVKHLVELMARKRMDNYL